MGHLYKQTESEIQNSPFTEAALSLLRKIEYRPMVSSEDIEQLYRFRYDCYLRDGWISANDVKLSYDKMDDDPNVLRYGLFMQDRMVSSIRLQHLTRERRLGPSMVIYPDIIEPMLNAGMSMIDPSRLAVDADASREYPILPHLSVRLAAMMSEHFEVDYCLHCIRPSHGAFYKRLTGARMIGDERYYDGMSFPIHLYASDMATCKDYTAQKYPFFKSLPVERRMLFGSPEQKPKNTLTVIPTADQAVAA